ncbi:hypothetical protein HPP92_017739 [Vanilla planifolia]|uniref:Uncharacterized protein n=1 Tax=Vanilla planifolia TaxID=51239 RepID=A0A835Q5S3_VANPL|nr:hypothetical protein HPP92_017739 [Vanilla planifolia]
MAGEGSLGTTKGLFIPIRGGISVLEWTEELVQDKYTGLKRHVSPAAEGHIISGSCFDRHDAGNESAYYERFILDDFDNYLDEINDDLTVSRLVSDSVIKRMVGAILGDYRKGCCEGCRNSHVEQEVANTQVQRLKEEIENLRHTNHHIAENVWSAGWRRLHSLGGSFDYLRVMLDGILNENFLRDVEEEYEAKLLKQRELISNLRTNYQLKVSELSEVHKDLDAIFMTLSNSDSGLLSSHTTTEYFEELNNTKWKDQFPIKASGDDHSPFASHPEENGTTVMQEPAFLKKLSKRRTVFLLYN